MFNCDLCGCKVRLRHNLWQHLRKVHGEDEAAITARKQAARQTNGGSLPCFVLGCPWSGMTYADLCDHAAAAHADLGDFSMKRAQFRNAEAYRKWLEVDGDNDCKTWYCRTTNDGKHIIRTLRCQWENGARERSRRAGCFELICPSHCTERYHKDGSVSVKYSTGHFHEARSSQRPLVGPDAKRVGAPPLANAGTQPKNLLKPRQPLANQDDSPDSSDFQAEDDETPENVDSEVVAEDQEKEQQAKTTMDASVAKLREEIDEIKAETDRKLRAVEVMKDFKHRKEVQERLLAELTRRGLTLEHFGIQRRVFLPMSYDVYKNIKK